jgi:hypothetical protein
MKYSATPVGDLRLSKGNIMPAWLSGGGRSQPREEKGDFVHTLTTSSPQYRSDWVSFET